MRTFEDMKLNSLKDLKVVKGKLAEESRPTAAGQSSTPASNQPRNRTVVHPSRAEERARNEGLSKGQKVRLMDSSDMGTITGFGDGYYEIDLDGMVIRAVRSEFVPVDPDEDRQLYTSIPSRVHKPARREVHEDAAGEITINLHLERIPGSEGIPEWKNVESPRNDIAFWSVTSENPPAAPAPPPIQMMKSASLNGGCPPRV